MIIGFAGWILAPAVAADGEADDFSWMRGANYVPSYAKNSVQLWMDYDPEVVDRELGYAAKLKLNTVRVFLQIAVFEKQPEQFMAALEDFLALCEKHDIRMMPVLFDSCADPQVVDVIDYHDKTWMPSPGFDRLGDEDWPAMEAYISAIVGKYRDDQRIVLWDVMNEPESTNKWRDWRGGTPENRAWILAFVRRALERVKDEDPMQPIGIGWSRFANIASTADLSGVLILHNYLDPNSLEAEIRQTKAMGERLNKPVIINEFVGRPRQEIEHALPVVTREGIGWCFWELMIGRTQFTQGERPYQGHIYPDGTCYSARDIAAILHPGGYEGDPEQIAAEAGFTVSERGLRGFTAEGIRFSPLWTSWKGPGPAGDRLWYARDAGERATKTVEGTRITVVLKHGPDCGIATVTVNGKPAAVAEIDAYSKDVDWNRRTVVAQGLPAGTHEVVVTVTGRKAAESSNRYVQVVDISGSEAEATEVWSAEKAWEWYNEQPWLVGFNYVPSYACNTTEWWQEETFDLETMDRELGWAADIGYNTTRVFIQYIVWKDNPEEFKKRFDQFLGLADKHGISVMPVLFDDCAFGAPRQLDPFLGKQREPIPQIHLPSWTPSPGEKLGRDPDEKPMLEEYVKDMISTFRSDPRIVIWDLYNEPLHSVKVVTADALEEIFSWAREASPTQPLTVAFWKDRDHAINRVLLAHSDIISFHRYADYNGVKKMISDFRRHGRPLIVTEWMGRTKGGNFATDLPLFKAEQVGCYQWGLVNGRTQAHYPRGHAPHPVDAQFGWHHDILHKDGTPYRVEEINSIRNTIRPVEDD